VRHSVNWQKELRKAADGSLRDILESGRDVLANLGLLRRRRKNFLRIALRIAGVAALGALVFGWLGREGERESPTS